MTRKDEGVVLKSGRSGETSRHIVFLGRHSGKVRLIGKGALTAKSPLRAVLQPGNLIEVVYYYKPERTLYFLKEATVITSLAGRDSLPQVAAILAALELLDQVCYWDSPDERVIDLYRELQQAGPGEDALLVFLAFEYRLLGIIGAMPNLSTCDACGGEVAGGFYLPQEGVSLCARHARSDERRVALQQTLIELVRGVERIELDRLASLRVDAALRKSLGRILHWTYTFHVHGYSLPEALKLIPRNGL